MPSLFIMIGMVVVMYFFMIRPQAKRAKEQKKFSESVITGEKIVTASGIHGTISDMNEGKVLIQIAENTRVWFDKTAIVTVTKK